jgi:ATP-dependent DNA helicase RecG
VQDVAGKTRQIEESLHGEISPPALWTVNGEHTSSGDIVAIDVPAGRDRPYVCAGSIFVRAGGETRVADAGAIRRMLQQQYAAPTRWERLAAPGLEVADLDASEVTRTADEARRTRNYAFREPGDPTAVLNDLGLVQSGLLTNAADVLFTKNPSTRLPQTRIRATVYATDKGGDFQDDRLFEGHAFSLLDQVFAFVSQHVQVAVEFSAAKLARNDRPQYPFAALREGLINAIVHRDYSAFSGGMAVSIYPTRIEVWNTGRLPDGLRVSDLKKDHPSLPANPDMAHVFYLRQVIERVGRGTLKILEDCKTAGLRLPQWKQSGSGITLVFFGRAHTPRLNRRQQSLLEELQPGDVVQPGEYYARMETSVSQRQAQRDLSGLESGGWLRKEGEGPSTVYVRTEREAP